MDLENLREVNEKIVEKYAKEKNCLFAEVSALTGKNLDDSF